MAEVIEEKVTEKAGEHIVASESASYMQQFIDLKQNFTIQAQKIWAHFPASSEDLIALKDTLKAEMNHIFDDVTKTSKEIKADFSSISTKHKAHLLETFKQSKAHTMEAFAKLKHEDVQAS